MRSTTICLLLVLSMGVGTAQDLLPESPGWFNRVGRPSIGLHGGANMWFNDFDTKDLSGGGDIFIRMAYTRAFSFGVVFGYDVLQSKNTNIQQSPAQLRNSYVEAKGFTFDAVAWFHTNYGKPVSPYVYVGIGNFFYHRKIQGDIGWPSEDSQVSIHIPLGVGVEVAMSKHVALTFDIGARILDKNSDNFKTGKQTFLNTDFYPTARAGLAVYFGTSDDDDSDGDGLTNGYEKSIGTSPESADTDGDRLTDYEEVTKYKTNPTVPDSDGDGLSDGDEVITYHTSPVAKDSDGDGLSDGEEVTTLRTDPLKVDTDGDSLSDAEEVRTYKTDPLKADTDGDGLQDGAEVRTHRTDPLKADTDGGSLNDGLEISRALNPLDPSDDVPKRTVRTVEVGKAIVLEGIVFKSGKTAIEQQSEETLMQAYSVLAENPEIAVQIRGYTDNVGSATANQRLSLRRAESVKAWLVSKGIAASRIAVSGLGAENPIGDNTTPEGRAQNRRIEFFRTK